MPLESTTQPGLMCGEGPRVLGDLQPMKHLSRNLQLLLDVSHPTLAPRLKVPSKSTKLVGQALDWAGCHCRLVPGASDLVKESLQPGPEALKVKSPLALAKVMQAKE